MFTGELRKYQVEDCQRMVKQRFAINATPCGLGKTVETISVCEFLLESGRVSSAFVFCRHPQEWVQMLNEFTDRDSSSICLYQGTPVQRGKLRDTFIKGSYFVCSHRISLQEADIEFLRRVVPGSALVIDEAHRIKTRTSRTSKALKGLGALSAYRFALTATPVWNRLDDLYGIMQFVDKDLFGSWSEFKEEYIIEYFGRIIDYKNLDKLRERISKKVIRRTREELKGQLPEVTYREVLVEPAVKHATLLKKLGKCIERELGILVDEGEYSWHKSPTYGKAFKFVTMLDQCSIVPSKVAEYAGEVFPTSDGRYDCPDSKLEEVIKLIDDIVTSKESVVVFCRYILGINRLSEMIKYKSFILTGKLSKKKQEEAISGFRDSAKKQSTIFLSSDVGGESLNIPEAKYVINVDCPWGSADLEQRNSRIQRMNSKYENVVVYQLLLPGLDEYKWAVAHWKGGAADIVLDGKQIKIGTRPKLHQYLSRASFDQKVLGGVNETLSKRHPNL